MRLGIYDHPLRPRDWQKNADPGVIRGVDDFERRFDADGHWIKQTNENGEPIPVFRSIFPLPFLWQYNNEFLSRSMMIYNNWRMFKVLPHGKGTMHERDSILQILRVLREEESLFDAWEREKDNKT